MGSKTRTKMAYVSILIVPKNNPKLEAEAVSVAKQRHEHFVNHDFQNPGSNSKRLSPGINFLAWFLWSISLIGFGAFFARW